MSKGTLQTSLEVQSSILCLRRTRCISAAKRILKFLSISKKLKRCLFVMIVSFRKQYRYRSRLASYSRCCSTWASCSVCIFLAARTWSEARRSSCYRFAHNVSTAQASCWLHLAHSHAHSISANWRQRSASKTRLLLSAQWRHTIDHAKALHW